MDVKPDLAFVISSSSSSSCSFLFFFALFSQSRKAEPARKNVNGEEEEEA
jgi:hypothetical protein